MRTKNFYLFLLLLVLGTANVWADKYYRVPNTNNSERYTTVPAVGKPFFIYNTAYLSVNKALNTTLDYTPKNFSATAKTRDDRDMLSFSLTSEEYGTQFVQLTTAQQAMPYVNMPTKIFRVNPGEEVSVSIGHERTSWVHSYIYIDHAADGFTLAFDKNKIHVSTDENAPAYIYKAKNDNNVYLTGETHPTNDAAAAGEFAFFAVPDVVGAYYIYSVTAGKWLTYTKADSYTSGKGFVQLADAKGEYFFVELIQGHTNKYQIRPYYNNGQIANIYINWFQGLNANAGTTLGLWTGDGKADNGSRYSFTLTTDIALDENKPTFTQVLPSSVDPSAGTPEYVYHMVSGHKKYVSGYADPAANSSDKGEFAFYNVGGVDGAYYIYSVTAGKWLSYTKGEDYGANGKAGIVKLVDNKADANYFKITTAWGNCHNIQPYTNDGESGFYLNYFGGAYDGTTLGVYNSASDPGSRFLIYSTDLVSFSYYTGSDTDENGGFNSNGEACSPGTSFDAPAFTAPTEPGFYRLRCKVDYNSVDPDGDKNTEHNTFMNNGGVIVDMVLQVVCDADYTGFLYNDGTKLGHTKHKGQDKVIFNECHLFTLESAGEDYAYYIKSLSTGTYVNIDGSTANETPQKVYIYTWYDALVGAEQTPDTWLDDGSVISNGAIKQTTSYGSENSTYSTVQNSQIDKSASNNNGVFIIASEDKSKYWAGTQSAFETAGEGMPFAFVIPDLVESNDYANIQDLHIYSRCDLYSAQQIYGYVQDGSMYSSQFIPSTDGGITWYECDLTRFNGLLDFDNTTYFHSAWQGDASSTNGHDLTADLGGKATTAFRFYFKKRIHQNNNCPTNIEIYGSNDGADFSNLITTISDGFPTAANELEYLSPVINCDSYTHLRFVVRSTHDDVAGSPNYFAFSEFYVLPSRTEIEHALSYLDSELPIVATEQKYTEIIEEYNSTVPEVKLLSGVPMTGNKYFIYADAYQNGAYVNLHVKTNDTDALSASSTDTYHAAADDDKDYFVWICEETVDGNLTFRNVKTGKYLANGSVQDAAYEWSINTCDTYRHGVPLKQHTDGNDGKYLAVQTLVADGSTSWLADVASPQNQTVGYTYVRTTTEMVKNDNGTPDDENDDFEEEVTTTETIVDNTRMVCTDFVFLPVDRDPEIEKKVTITASSDLAIRNSEFRFNGVGYSLPFTRLLQKFEFEEGTPDLIYTMQDGYGRYVTALTDHTENADEVGYFAFYAVPDVADAYYIYSLSEKKWLTYEQPAADYAAEGTAAFTTLSSAKDEKSYFKLETINVDEQEYKQIVPYFENVATKYYLNWYGGGDVAIGIINRDGTGLEGSRFTFVQVETESFIQYQNNLSITERVGDYHQFVGFYRKDANGDYTEEITTAAAGRLNFDDVNDGDYIEARFEIVKPFELSSNGTYNFYALKNVTDGRYAAYAGDNALMTLEDAQSALTLFYFTNGETDADLLTYSHSSGYIEHAITHSKLSDAGETAVNNKPAKWTNGGQLYYMQPNRATNGNQGYAITTQLLGEDSSWAHNGLCGDKPKGTVGKYGANDPYAVWQFVPVSESDADNYLTEFINDFVTSIQGKLTTQGESDLYDDNKISIYNDHITALNTEASTAELSRLVEISQELFAINVNINALTLYYPEITETVTVDSYLPKWYYLKNVKSETYIAEYVGDDVEMKLTNTAAGDFEKKLAHLFYFGGTLMNEDGTEATDGYSLGAYMKSCIHNFAAHVHNPTTNAIVDKTLVSENEVLFDDVKLQGTGTKNQVIFEAANSGVLLENSLPWNVEFEGNSDGSGINGWGSSLLATGNEALANTYDGGFQVYLKLDGYILVKLGGEEKNNFDHTKNLFSTYKVEIAWRPDEGTQNTEKVDGTISFTITNSNGESRKVDYVHKMKDVKKLTTAIPAGVNITQMSGEVVNAMKWNESHDESNWYILPSSNTNFPGLSIVTTSPADNNKGWSNKGGTNSSIEQNTGNLDASTWQFVRVTDFTEHIEELLSTWSLDNAVVYNEALVNLYKDLVAARLEYGNTEEAFNTMVSLIRSYTGLTVDEILNTSDEKFYVLRPTNSNSKHAAVSVFNSLATQEGLVADGEYDSRAVFTFTGTNEAMEMVNLHTQSHVGELDADSVLLDAASAHEVKLQPIGACLVRVVSGDKVLATNTSNNMLVGVENNDLATVPYTSTMFKRSDEGVNDYEVPVTNLTASIIDAHGNIAGSVAVGSSHALKTGGNSDTFDNTILCPNINASALNGGAIELTFTYSDLPDGFTGFNNIGLYIHALNGVGTHQAADAERIWSIKAEVGADAGSLEVFGTLDNVDIIPDANESMWNITSNAMTTVTGNSLVVKLTITAPTDNPGCFIGLENIVLSSEGNIWYIEEVADKTNVYHATTVNSLGLGSLMLGYKAQAPEGIQAYYPTATNDLADKHVTMESYAGGVIPAETPVLLDVEDGYDNGATYKFYYTEAAATDPGANRATASDGVLIDGSLYQQVVPADKYDDEMNSDCRFYMFVTGQAQPKLYWAWESFNAEGVDQGATDAPGHIMCRANRAYVVFAENKIAQTPAASAASLSLRLNRTSLPTTGVDDMRFVRENKTNSAIDGIFDLQGRRINEISAPGIYIVNGKKVVVK